MVVENVKSEQARVGKTSHGTGVSKKEKGTEHGSGDGFVKGTQKDKDLAKMEAARKSVSQDEAPPPTAEELKEQLKQVEAKSQAMEKQLRQSLDLLKTVIPPDQLKMLAAQTPPSDGKKDPGSDPTQGTGTSQGGTPLADNTPSPGDTTPTPPTPPGPEPTPEDLIKAKAKLLQDTMREQVRAQMEMKAKMMEMDTFLMQEKFEYERVMVMYEHQQKLYDMTKAALMKVREASETMWLKVLEMENKLDQKRIQVLMGSG